MSSVCHAIVHPTPFDCLVITYLSGHVLKKYHSRYRPLKFEVELTSFLHRLIKGILGDIWFFNWEVICELSLIINDKYLCGDNNIVWLN